MITAERLRELLHYDPVDELNERVVAHMKGNPALSYQQAFTREYLHPDNRSLKDRVDSESILRAQRLEPAKPFPAYARG